MAITGTKAELAFIRKHNRSPLRPPTQYDEPQLHDEYGGFASQKCPSGQPEPGLEAVPSLDNCYQQSCTVDTFQRCLSAISRKEYHTPSRSPITRPRSNLVSC
ncbi:hypothetical protein TNCV_1907941 [Trichonephila clavipes]|nr:hypothetical protein TNCV_1907941 [Trichonephila clavipes]